MTAHHVLGVMFSDPKGYDPMYVHVTVNLPENEGVELDPINIVGSDEVADILKSVKKLYPKFESVTMVVMPGSNPQEGFQRVE